MSSLPPLTLHRRIELHNNVTINCPGKATARIIPGLIGALLLLRLGAMIVVPLMDTTEARYAEIARKMAELNDWVTPWFDYGIPYWGKPPFSFWLTAISFKILGVTAFAARLPHLIVSSAIVGLVAWMAHRKDADSTWPAIACIFGAPLFLICAGAVLTDMELTLGCTLTMAGFWIALEEHSNIKPRAYSRSVANLLFFGGLVVGMLAKGPVSWLLTTIPILLWTGYYARWRDMWRALAWITGITTTLLISLPWYALAERHTPGFLKYFLIGEHFERFISPGWHGDLYGNAHRSPVGAIWLFAFVDLLPWTVLLPVAAWRWRQQKTLQREKSTPVSISLVAGLSGASAAAHSDTTRLRLYLFFWALTPLVLFTMARNVGWTYILPGLPPAALLAGQWLATQGRQGRNINRLLTAGLALTMCLILAAAIPWLQPATMERKSAKALLAAYAQSLPQRNAAPSTDLAGSAVADAMPPLIFVHRRPFSAQFYTGGKAILVRDADEAWSRIGRGAAYVAVSSADIFMNAAKTRKDDRIVSGPDNVRENRSVARIVRRIGRYGNFDLVFVYPL